MKFEEAGRALDREIEKRVEFVEEKVKLARRCPNCCAKLRRDWQSWPTAWRSPSLSCG